MHKLYVTKKSEIHSFQTLFYDLVLCTKIHTHTHTHTQESPGGPAGLHTSTVQLMQV